VNAEHILRAPIVSESSIRETTPKDGAWTWSTCGPSPKLGNVRFADFSPEGHCLVATTRGIFFWDGGEWRSIEHTLDLLATVRFVRFVGLGRWVIGAGDIWLYAFGELSLLWTHGEIAFDHFDGAIDDVALASGRGANGKPVFVAHIDGRWREPLVLAELSRVATISRIDESEWLVTGETNDGESFAASVSPVMRRMKRLRSQPVRVFVASAGVPKLGVGCAVGFGGALLCDRVAAAVEETSQPTAVAIDPNGRILVASPGRLLIRRGAPEPSWETVWKDENSLRPIVAVALSTRSIHALSNDASVLEGRVLADLGEEDDDDEVTKPEIPAR
jgi:hypothetical protein